MDQLRRLNFSSKSLWLLLFLMGSGFAGNFFSPRLFIGFNYLFGSVAVLLVVYLYGIRWGMVAGVIVSSWTISLFGHPYAMVWLIGEPLFVGWLLSKGRTRNIILYDVVYWPLFGVPLIWVFFQHVMHVSVPGTVAALLMYWVIGITNALIASLLLTYIPRLSTIGEPKRVSPIPIQKLIFNLLMAVVLIPAMAIMVIHGKDTDRRILDDMYDDLEDSSRIALYEMRLKLQKQVTGLSELSELPEKLDPTVSVKIEPFQMASELLLESKIGDLKDMLLTSRVKPFYRMVLVDDTDKVIASTSDDHPMDVFNSCPNGVIKKVDSNSNIYRCMPNPPATLVPLWHRAEKSTYLIRASVANGTAWSIITETSFAPYQRLLFEDHIRALLIVLSLNMLALMASLYISRRLAAPLRLLSQVTTDLPERLLREKNTDWPNSMVIEVDQLIDNFRAMSTALRQKFHEITKANETLELRVEERTMELSRANEELHKENVERKLTERQRDHLMNELVGQVHFLQTLIDALPSPVFYKDANGLYQGCNRAFEECWGFSREEIVGKSVHELYPVGIAESFCKADQELFKQGGVQVYEALTQYKSDSSNHTVIFSKAVYKDAQGNLGGLVGTVVDITQRKKAETERDHLMIELKQKNKELEGIIYIASHDLRSPLVNVQGFSRKLAKNCAELDKMITGLEMHEEQRLLLVPIIRESIPRSLGFITGSVEKMDGLLGGLLRLSRLGRAALCFATLDMRMLLEQIVSSMTFQIDSINGRVELGELGSCVADAGQVTQVFSNLLDNAIKYRSPDRPLCVKVFSEEIDMNIRYCVEDNGVGILRQHQEVIWEIFQRLNPDETQGEGLGLTMTRRIVDHLGGSIWVESEPGIGSRFYVLLPKSAETLS